MKAFLPSNKSLFLVNATVNILYFISGISIVWSSPIIPILENKTPIENPLNREITAEEKSWIGSLTALGGILSPFLSGYLADRIGRKLTLTLIILPFFVSFIIAAFAKCVELFYVSRSLMGVGIGMVFSLSPIYFIETTETSNRGFFQAMTASNLKMGILFTYCVGPFVSVMGFNLILAGICVLLLPGLWFIVPETPYFLIRQNKEEGALEILKIIRPGSPNRIQEEFEEMKSHIKKLEQGSYLDIFRTKVAFKACCYGLALVSFQQFSGVSILFYFTQSIFLATGSDLPSEICSIIIGAVHLTVALAAPNLLDRVGRKPLLYISASGALIGALLLSVYLYLQSNGNDVSHLGWYPLASLIVFIVFYNLGLAPIPWAVATEILPLNIITKGLAIVSSFYWFTGFFLSKYYWDMSKTMGTAGPFWFFACFDVLCNLFNFFFMFETKGKSLKEIQDIMAS